MAPTIQYESFTPSLITISLGKQSEMTDDKGKKIPFRMGDIIYPHNGVKDKLLLRLPECEIPNGVYLSDNKKTEESPQQAYNVPSIGGVQQVAPKRGSKNEYGQVEFSLRVALKTVDTNHQVIINKLNELDRVVNGKLYELKDNIYSERAVENQFICNRGLVAYPVTSDNKVDLEGNPSLWIAAKKKPIDLDRLFMLPNNTYVPYKKLVGCTIVGYPLISFSLFFNAINKTCKMKLEGFVLTEIKLNQVAKDMNAIASDIMTNRPDAVNSMTDVLSKLEEMSSKNSVDNTCEEESLGVTLPQTIANPVTIQPPQTQGYPNQPMTQQYQQGYPNNQPMTQHYQPMTQPYQQYQQGYPPNTMQPPSTLHTFIN